MSEVAEEMLEPLPCPFCGGKPEMTDYRETSDQTGESYGYAAVECHCLGADGGLFFHFGTLPEAVAAWNRRTPIASPSGVGAKIKCGDGFERTLPEWLAMFETMTQSTGFLWMAKDARQYLAALSRPPREEFEDGRFIALVPTPPTGGKL